MPTPVIDSSKAPNSDKFYAEAQETLPENFYLLYRIVDRLARANALDERSWRVRLGQGSGGTATDLNTLTFSTGVMDQFYGDNAALACVVGRQMASHGLNHLATVAEFEARTSQLMAEAEAQAIAEVQSAQRRRTTTNTIGSILGGVLGSILGGTTGAIVGGTTQAILGTMTAGQQQQAEVRANQIYQDKVAALNAEYAAILQSQQYEADAYAYQFLVRAGFDPQGCQRAMSVLSQLEPNQSPGRTPLNPAARLQRLNQLATQVSLEALVAEGRTYLSENPRPLGYSVSRDGAVLRIESRNGPRATGFPN
ncbi:MAG TPA: hypothetical protein IGR64_04190 [Leptolyngbyaceae cyanobacterium M65_K2018_010]|nr:hypothetical protein [Leptolyngbyaceae cyanobacterium M65_K2018_010]